MSWTWARRILVVFGLIYAWALLPVSIRPHLGHTPLRKSEQTITFDADAHGRYSLTAANVARLRTACRAPVLLRPVMGPADKVTVDLTNGVRLVGVVEVSCKHYG